MNYLLNAMLPGSGLIGVGRPWLGMILAVLFGVCAHVVLAGWLVVPQAWPRSFTWIALGLEIATWLAGQRLLQSRLRLMRSTASAAREPTEEI